MKHLKKVLCAMTAIVMALSFAACGEEESSEQDPVDIYLAAAEKTEALGDLDMTMDMTSTMDIEGESMDITYAIDAKIKDYNTDTMQLQMAMDMGLFGTEIPMNVYYNEGHYYIDAMGQKMSYSMDLQEMMTQMENQMGMGSYPEESIQSIEVSEDNKTLTLVIDGAVMSDFINQMMATSLNTTTDTADFTIGDIDCVITLNDDGYIETQTMDFTMNMNLDVEGSSTSFSMSIHADSTYNNIGQEVTIEFPDFSEYTDMGSFSDLTAQATQE